MPRTTIPATTYASSALVTAAGPRIDAGHAAAAQEAAIDLVSPLAGASVGAIPAPPAEADIDQVSAAFMSPISRQEQLQAQAEDLAAHFTTRIREIDRREAELNARIAQLESEARISRLWQRERQFEFEEREAALQRELSELQARSAAVASGEMNLESLDETEARLDERDEELHQLDSQLRERRIGLDREAGAIRHAQQMWEQYKHQQELQFEADCRKAASQYEEQRQALETEFVERTQRIVAEQIACDSDRNAAAQAAQRSADAETITLAAAAQAEAFGIYEQELRERYEHREAQLRTQYEQRSEQMQRHFEERDAALSAAEQRWEHERSELTASLAAQYSAQASQSHAEQRERRQRLDGMERQLDLQRRELQKQLVGIAEERKSHQRQQLEQREALVARIAGADAELEQRRAEVASREAHLERQKDAVEQVRSEITQAQREALEMRIIAEQLWAQVTGRLGAPEITRSIASLRLQLADHYRLQHQAILEQQEEAFQLGERVQQNHLTLQRQREDLKAWACRQQTEIERQAQRLVTRELELDGQCQALETSQRAWLEDRRQLEQQVQSLREKLGQQTAMAAT